MEAFLLRPAHLDEASRHRAAPASRFRVGSRTSPAAPLPCPRMRHSQAEVEQPLDLHKFIAEQLKNDQDSRAAEPGWLAYVVR